MPTYVYGCDTCGHRFEIFQKFQDAPLKECPQCGASIRKIFQPAGIVFKGSGWYSTDSRAGSNGHSAEKSAEAGNGTSDGAASTSDGASTSKSDNTAKPASKATTSEKSSAAGVTE